MRLIGPRTERSSSAIPVRSVVAEELALLLREQLGDRPLAHERLLHLRRITLGLHRSGADEPARHGVDLDAEARRLADLRGNLVGDDRPQLDDRVPRLALDPPRSHHDPALVEREVRRVEERNLADLRIEHVHAKCQHRRSVVAVGHGQLQLHAVGSLDQPEQLGDLLVGEQGGGVGDHGCLDSCGRTPSTTEVNLRTERRARFTLNG